MNDKLLKSLYELKNAIDNDGRMKNLLRIEKEMENNEEVILLARIKDNINDRYNDLLKIYDEKDERVTKVQEELYVAKKALDEHPLVKEYLKAYKEVRLMYEKVDETLIKPFKTHVCEDKECE